MLFDYVVAEVLDRLPDDERDAVLVLSLLDDIDGSRCTAMTGVADGASLVRRLLGRGSTPRCRSTPSSRPFASTSSSVTSSSTSSSCAGRTDLAALHRRAAEAERAAGDIPAAVRHYLAAGDTDAAFGLVVTPVWDLYRAGRTRDAAVWLGQFPDEFVAEDPARILSYAVALSFVGRLEDAARWNERAAPLVTGDVALSSELAISWMLVHLGRADTAAVRADFEQLSRLRPGRCFDWDPTNRVITIMAIAALVDEDLEDAGTWVAAIETATSMRRAAEPGRAVPLARRGSRSNAGRWPTPRRFADESLSCAGPELSGEGHALVEAVRREGQVGGGAHGGRRGRRVGRAGRRPRRRAGRLRSTRRSLVRPTVAAIEARAGAAEALRRLEQMTTAAQLTPALRVRHAPPRRGARGALRTMRRGRASDLRAARWPAAAPSSSVESQWIEVGPQRSTICCPSTRRGRRGDRSKPSCCVIGRHPGEATHLRRALELGADAGFVVHVPPGRARRRGRPRARRVGRARAGARRGWRRRSAIARQAGPSTTMPLVEPLSEKERQVLQFLPTHLSAIEIASQAYVSVNTLADPHQGDLPQARRQHAVRGRSPGRSTRASPGRARGRLMRARTHGRDQAVVATAAHPIRVSRSGGSACMLGRSADHGREGGPDEDGPSAGQVDRGSDAPGRWCAGRRSVAGPPCRLSRLRVSRRPRSTTPTSRRACGLDILLILDESGSVKPYKADVQAAYRSFTDENKAPLSDDEVQEASEDGAANRTVANANSLKAAADPAARLFGRWHAGVHPRASRVFVLKSCLLGAATVRRST